MFQDADDFVFVLVLGDGDSLAERFFVGKKAFGDAGRDDAHRIGLELIGVTEETTAASPDLQVIDLGVARRAADQA